MARRARTWNEKRKAMRKQSVHEACVRILLRDGVDGMTMDSVSQEAQVAKGTLYNYFAGKEDLLASVEEHLFAPIRERLLKIMAVALPARVRMYLIALHLARQFDQHRAETQLVLAEFASHPLSPESMADPKRQRIHEALTDVCRQLRATDGRRWPEAHLLARLFAGALLGLLEHRLACPAPRSIRSDLVALMSVFFPESPSGDPADEGVCPDPPVQGVPS